MSRSSKPSLPHRPQCCVQDSVAAAPGQGVRRTIVFAVDVAAADAVAEELEAGGMQPLVYHRKVPPEQRAQALAAMAERWTSCQLLCVGLESCFACWRTSMSMYRDADDADPARHVSLSAVQCRHCCAVHPEARGLLGPAACWAYFILGSSFVSG